VFTTTYYTFSRLATYSADQADYIFTWFVNLSHQLLYPFEVQCRAVFGDVNPFLSHAAVESVVDKK